MKGVIVIVEVDDGETLQLVEKYLAALQLPRSQLRVTTERETFETWLGRRVGSSLGGAYAFLPRQQAHIVLINLKRIDRSKPKSLEVVVAEELIHMRDRLDGDVRRHAKHGHDRIAYKVSSLTGATLDEIRGSLLPRREHVYRYAYTCPVCGMTIRRKRRGTWSCGRCAPAFDRRYVLQMTTELERDASG